MSLKVKTEKGLIWSTVDTFGMNFFRIIITILLARLLQPNHFGLIAMLSVFVSLSDSIVYGGFSSALIRKKNIEDKDYSTVFIFNFLVSIALYVLIYAGAPYIASFFGEPILKALARVVALVIVFHSFGLVQTAILKRNIDFKSLALINILSTLFSGLTGILMAYQGFGVWSLAGQMVSKALLTSILLWVFGKWSLKLRFSQTSFKENFNFGYKVSLVNIMGALVPNLYNAVIGKYYSPGSLGLYYQGNKLATISQSFIMTVFKTVSYPVFSSLQDKPEQLKDSYLKFIRMVSFVSFPTMMLFIVIAEPAIVLLLSDKWIESVPYFQILSIKGMILPVIAISANIPLALGRSGIYLKYSILNSGLLLAFLFITAPIGIKAMVGGMVLVKIISLFINLWLVSKMIDLKVSVQLFALSKLLGISILTGAISYSFVFLIEQKVLLMSTQIIVFTLLYVGAQSFLGSNELMDVKNLLHDRFGKLLSKKSQS